MGTRRIRITFTGSAPKGSKARVHFFYGSKNGSVDDDYLSFGSGWPNKRSIDAIKKAATSDIWARKSYVKGGSAGGQERLLPRRDGVAAGRGDHKARQAAFGVPGGFKQPGPHCRPSGAGFGDTHHAIGAPGPSNSDARRPDGWRHQQQRGRWPRPRCSVRPR
ncbi:hypothetical protein [Actinomadura sp. 6N118]|uniref:hypothetical protein n=1 Tax=Actinomadura sp. 6N118 TaxID=3375151 RepID=UPI003797F10B